MKLTKGRIDMNQKLVIIKTSDENVVECLRKAFPVHIAENQTLNQILCDLDLDAFIEIRGK